MKKWIIGLAFFTSLFLFTQFSLSRESKKKIAAKEKVDAEEKLKLPPMPKNWKLKGDKKAGEKTYKTNCALCHGKKGDGKGIMARSMQPPLPTDFTDIKAMKKRSDWRLYNILREGGGKFKLSQQMAAYKNVFNDQQVHNLITYIKTFAEDKKKKQAKEKK